LIFPFVFDLLLAVSADIKLTLSGEPLQPAVSFAAHKVYQEAFHEEFDP